MQCHKVIMVYCSVNMFATIQAVMPNFVKAWEAHWPPGRKPIIKNPKKQTLWQ